MKLRFGACQVRIGATSLSAWKVMSPILSEWESLLCIVVNVAYGPLAIDSDEELFFLPWWIGIVAKANGKSNSAGGMPIRSFP